MNWNSFTYRQKNKVLLAGTVVLLLICYFFAFSNTINLYLENSRMQDKLTSLQTAPQQIAGLKKQLNFLNRNVEQYVRDADFEQEDVLVNISNFCKDHSLRIVEFPQSTQKQKEDVFIETFNFTVEGSFTNLVQLMYHIEVEKKIGRIASCKFEIETDRRTKVRRLVVNVHLQNLREHDV